MKAIIWTKYGPPDVLQMQEIEKPTPKDNEVLVKVHASSVTAGDCEIRAVKFPLWLSVPMRLYMGWNKPKKLLSLGQDFAGEIEAVGQAVTRFKVGDLVFGCASFGEDFGAYAEYICTAEEGEDNIVLPKPANMSYDEAAGVPTGSLESLHYLRKASIQPGQKVLINGAGGSIGTFGVQLAKYYGAEVTAVDSTTKLDMLRSIGADHVIDYTREDFARNDQKYDVVFDVVGKRSFSRGIRALKPGGLYLLANPRLHTMFRGVWVSRRGRKKVIFSFTSRKTEDLMFIRELIEAGKLKTVIDRNYPLEQTVEAHRYVETGQKKGNVIITVAHQ